MKKLTDSSTMRPWNQRQDGVKQLLGCGGSMQVAGALEPLKLFDSSLQASGSREEGVLVPKISKL